MIGCGSSYNHKLTIRFHPLPRDIELRKNGWKYASQSPGELSLFFDLRLSIFLKYRHTIVTCFFFVLHVRYFLFKTQNPFKSAVKKIRYAQLKWLIRVDLKMRTFCKDSSPSSPSSYPCSLWIWDSTEQAQHYTKEDWPVREELVRCRAINVINNPLVSRQYTLPTAAYQAWLDQTVYQSSGLGWWLFHLLVPRCSRIDRDVESWHLWWSSTQR